MTSITFPSLRATIKYCVWSVHIGIIYYSAICILGSEDVAVLLWWVNAGKSSSDCDESRKVKLRLWGKPENQARIVKQAGKSTLDCEESWAPRLGLCRNPVNECGDFQYGCCCKQPSQRHLCIHDFTITVLKLTRPYKGSEQYCCWFTQCYV